MDNSWPVFFKTTCIVLVNLQEVAGGKNCHRIEFHRESSLVTQSTSCAIATAMKLHCKCKISNCLTYFDKDMFCLYIKLQKESPFLFLVLRCAWDFGVSFCWIDSVWKSTLQWWQEELFTFSTKKRNFSYDQKISLFKTTNAELIYSCAIKTKNFFGKTHRVIQRHSHTTCVHTWCVNCKWLDKYLLAV